MPYINNVNYINIGNRITEFRRAFNMDDLKASELHNALEDCGYKPIMTQNRGSMYNSKTIDSILANKQMMSRILDRVEYYRKLRTIPTNLVSNPVYKERKKSEKEIEVEKARIRAENKAKAKERIEKFYEHPAPDESNMEFVSRYNLMKDGVFGAEDDELKEHLLLSYGISHINESHGYINFIYNLSVFISEEIFNKIEYANKRHQNIDTIITFTEEDSGIDFGDIFDMVDINLLYEYANEKLHLFDSVYMTEESREKGYPVIHISLIGDIKNSFDDISIKRVLSYEFMRAYRDLIKYKGSKASNTKLNFDVIDNNIHNFVNGKNDSFDADYTDDEYDAAIKISALFNAIDPEEIAARVSGMYAEMKGAPEMMRHPKLAYKWIKSTYTYDFIRVVDELLDDVTNLLSDNKSKFFVTDFLTKITGIRYQPEKWINYFTGKVHNMKSVFDKKASQMAYDIYESRYVSERRADNILFENLSGKPGRNRKFFIEILNDMIDSI